MGEKRRKTTNRYQVGFILIINSSYLLHIMGNDNLLFSDLGASLNTITSTLSSITSLSSCINAITSLAQRILVDVEEIRMRKEKLDEIEGEVSGVMEMVKLKMNELHSRDKRLDKKEAILRKEEERLRVVMKKWKLGNSS